MAPEDQKILNGCLRGEKNAWDSFVERYSRLVYWSIWKALGSSSAPDKKEACREAFQEFFRRMLEPSRIEKLLQAQNLQKYLQVSAQNIVFERFRRTGIMDRIELAGEAVDGVSAAADPSEQAAQSERRAILESVLGRLKPKERECLELHYLDGHTHQEIAGFLGMPRDTVSTILQRTKEKLKEHLRRKGISE